MYIIENISCSIVPNIINEIIYPLSKGEVYIYAKKNGDINYTSVISKKIKIKIIELNVPDVNKYRHVANDIVIYNHNIKFITNNETVMIDNNISLRINEYYDNMIIFVLFCNTNTNITFFYIGIYDEMYQQLEKNKLWFSDGSLTMSLIFLLVSIIF